MVGCRQGLSALGGEKPCVTAQCRQSHRLKSLKSVRNKDQPPGAGTSIQQTLFWLLNPLSDRSLKAVISGKVMKVNGEDPTRCLYMFFCILAWKARRRDR